MMRHGNMNGERGQTGTLQTLTLTTDTTLLETMGGAVLEVDPAGGALTITLPATDVGPGWFAEVVQIGAGTVTLAAGAGATLVSPGALTDLAGQWSAATIRRRDGSGEWIANGDLA